MPSETLLCNIINLENKNYINYIKIVFSKTCTCHGLQGLVEADYGTWYPHSVEGWYESAKVLENKIAINHFLTAKNPL